MPTFKLDDDEPDSPYMGDSDMYFRQWRVRSMQPVLDEKLDRDFAESQTRRENREKEREIRRKLHSEKFDQKLEKLSQQFRSANLSTGNEKPTTSLLHRKSTEEEKRLMREAVEREYAKPSSTATMIPASKQFAPRPRKNPVFGNAMASRENIVKPKPFKVLEPATSTPTNLNNSQESVFFPQEHNSFNLDEYNGARPSFMFNRKGATSTPVSKLVFKLSDGSQVSQDVTFDSSNYVTALESPIKEGSSEDAEKQRQRIQEMNRLLEKNGEEMRIARALEDRERSWAEDVRKIREIARQARADEEKNREVEEQRKRREIELAKKKSEFGKMPEMNEEEMRMTTDFRELERNWEENVRKIGEMARRTQQARAEEEKKQMENLMNREAREQQIRREIEIAEKAAFLGKMPEVESRDDSKDFEDSKEESSSTEDLEKRPFLLFKKFVDLKSRIDKNKMEYDAKAEPKTRSLLRRTITEKITIFTHKNTTEAEKKHIIEFFRTLLKKLPVDAYSLNEDSKEKLQLSTSEDVEYSIFCIVDKYLSLVALNIPTPMDELIAPTESSFASTVGDLISRISASAKKMETIFIALIMNQSVVLRQKSEECIKVFEEYSQTLDVSQQTMIMNREKCLVELFITVFVKNAYFASRNIKLHLTNELLWEYAERVLNWCVEVPKSSILLAYLLTIAKPRLEEQQERWLEFIDYLKNEALPTMLEYENDNQYVHDSSVTFLEEIVKKLKL